MASPIQNMSTTTNGTNQNRTDGPLAVLETSKFQKSTYSYPLDLGSRNDRLHAMQFFINVQQNSSYLSTNSYNLTGGSSVADINRASIGAHQIASSSNALQSNPEVAAGLGAIGGAVAGTKLAKGGTTGAKVVGAITGAAAGALTGAALATIIKSIDLTRKTKRIDTTVSLYMPDTLAFTYAHDYDQLSMTAALGKLGFTLQTAQSLEDSIGETTGQQGATGAGSGPAAPKASTAEIMGTAAEKSGAVGSGFTQVALFSAGFAQNPQFEMLYRSTNNRQFQFQFTFVPRNSDEAKQIQKIIQTFRFHAAPEVASGANNAGGRYLVPPSEFDIVFLYNGVENKNIPKISTCILENIDLNFAAGGTWTAFDDGAPVEITMTLQFKEIEMIHKDLITQGY